MYKYAVIIVIHGIFTNWNFINVASVGHKGAMQRCQVVMLGANLHLEWLFYD